MYFFMMHIQHSVHARTWKIDLVIFMGCPSQHYLTLGLIPRRRRIDNLLVRRMLIERGPCAAVLNEAFFIVFITGGRSPATL